MVTHLSTNWAQCRVTTLIETNALLLSHTTTQQWISAVQSNTKICRESHYEYTALPCSGDLLCKCQQSNVVFWIWSSFRLTDNMHCILLSLESSGHKVTIPHIITVVHTVHRQIQTIALGSSPISITVYTRCAGHHKLVSGRHWGTNGSSQIGNPKSVSHVCFIYNLVLG